MKVETKAKLLESLGLKAAAEKLLRKKGGKEKLLKALEQYRYATGEDLDDFNEEMKKYGKELVVDKIEDCQKLPPDDVLTKLQEAIELKCFDTFYVAYIRRINDPILFGKIDYFTNLYFFIAQWGDDVKIEKIIGTI